MKKATATFQTRAVDCAGNFLILGYQKSSVARTAHRAGSTIWVKELAIHTDQLTGCDLIGFRLTANSFGC